MRIYAAISGLILASAIHSSVFADERVKIETQDADIQISIITEFAGDWFNDTAFAMVYLKNTDGSRRYATWEDASRVCSGTIDGLKGWRLPTSTEIYTSSTAWTDRAGYMAGGSKQYVKDDGTNGIQCNRPAYDTKAPKVAEKKSAPIQKLPTLTLKPDSPATKAAPRASTPKPAVKSAPAAKKAAPVKAPCKKANGKGCDIQK
jgi:hypothetical protein